MSSLKTRLLLLMACYVLWLPYVNAFLLDDDVWEAGQMTFHANFADTKFDDGFEQAGNAWTDLSLFKVSVVKNSSPPDVSACNATVNSANPVNGTIFDADACGNGYGDGTLAISFSSSSSGKRTWTGITFRNDQAWDVYSGPLTSVNEFRRVAIHEIGHSLGLNHTNDPAAPANSIALCSIAELSRPIMCATLGDNEVPLQDDLDGVAAMYDPDKDNVGVFADNCLVDSNSNQSNIDGDVKGDACDDDIDGDGVFNGNTIDQGFTTLGEFNQSINGDNDQLLGQVVTTGISGTLVGVNLPVRCITGDLILSIQGVDTDGLPDGVMAATETIAGTTISTDVGFRDFTFSSPVAFTVGQQFSIVTNSTDLCRYSTSPVGNLYAGGDGSFNSTINNRWVKFNQFANNGDDLPFQTVVAPTVTDNCPLLANSDQADANSNGTGDACETVSDSDGDGMDNTVDTDDDNDGFLDAEDAFPLDPTKNSNLLLVSAVLPTSRSVTVGNTATAFATIINAGTGDAPGCRITPITGVTANFFFQTTNPATNALTGTRDASVDIATGAAQTFVFGFTPTAAFGSTDMKLQYRCTNASAAGIVTGVNTLLLSASITPIPDIVALGATVTNDGIVHIPGAMGTGFFSLASVNVGVSDMLLVSVDTGSVVLPIVTSLCQTDPGTGACINPATPTTGAVTLTIDANATPTFAVFVQGTENISLDAANKRIFVRFKDAGGVTRGSTSVAVQTD